MEYLKLFEQFSLDMYRKVDSLVSFVSNKKLKNSDISDSEIKKIKKFFPKFKIKINDSVIHLYEKRFFTKKYPRFNIYKFDDDWFVCDVVTMVEKMHYSTGGPITTRSEKHIYYECDQIDGLIQCLKDNPVV